MSSEETTANSGVRKPPVFDGKSVNFNTFARKVGLWYNVLSEKDKKIAGNLLQGVQSDKMVDH